MKAWEMELSPYDGGKRNKVETQKNEASAVRINESGTGTTYNSLG